MKDKLPKEPKELSSAYTLEMDTRFKKSWLQASKFHNLHKQEKKRLGKIRNICIFLLSSLIPSCLFAPHLISEGFAGCDWIFSSILFRVANVFLTEFCNSSSQSMALPQRNPLKFGFLAI